MATKQIRVCSKKDLPKNVVELQSPTFYIHGDAMLVVEGKAKVKKPKSDKNES